MESDWSDWSENETLIISQEACVEETNDGKSQSENVPDTETFTTYRNLHQSESDSEGPANDNVDSKASDVSCDEADRLSHSLQSCRTTNRKAKQRFKHMYIDSSDEDMPLSYYAKRAWTTSFGDSSEDNTYDPKKECDLNSTDSEYETLIDKETKNKRKKDEKLKKAWMKGVSEIRKNKEKEKPKSKRDKHSIKHKKGGQFDDTKQHTQTADIIHQVLKETVKTAELRKDLIDKETAKVDSLLRANHLLRKDIKPYGNCFFEACGIQLGVTAPALRSQLCKVLEDNIEDYIAFVLNSHHPDNKEAFVREYLEEIEQLKEDGYWTSNVADVLPLALANHTGYDLILYTNKEEQPIIKVSPVPSCKQQTNTKFEIQLAYTSIPGILEHYDAVEELLIATPAMTEQIHEHVTEEHNNTPSNQENTTPQPKSPLKKTSPRKKAVFKTPEKKFITRKRKAAPQNWKKNIRKKLRLSGNEYVSTGGKTVTARTLQPVDCSKCRLKCGTKLTHDQRQQLFDSFWKLGSYERQKDYVCGRVTEVCTKTQCDEAGNVKPKRKQVTRKFSFEIDDVKHDVCKRFFMKTLSLGKSYIEHAMKFKKEGHFSGEDLQGKHEPHNKLKRDDTEHVKRHIESFPTVAGHYVRKETNRKYLSPGLTLPKMYDLYLEICRSEEREPVKLSKYRQIFNENYNLSFHVPKKDQCNTCNRYHTAVREGTISKEQKETFEKHQSRKQRAREEKESDKNMAKTNTTTHTACFDLQSVLYTPCSLVSLMYYMRKLCCYNLSFYSLGNTEGTCFVWSEVDAKRGASEIATCLRLYLLSLPENVNHVILYSDACGGQNRNKIIASCLLNAINTIKHLEMIDHKFLESGHSHMEVDSMHAAVEFAKKKTQIFVPSQWDTVLQMARRKKPYTVIPVKHTDILDVKDHQQNQTKIQKKAESGVKVMWSKMIWMRYIRSDPDTCYFKYSYEEEFEKVKFNFSKRHQESLQPKYNRKIPISSAKKKDLMQLCKTGTIPSEFHEYYKNIPSSNNSKDCLPEPDAQEDSNDEYEED